jgi:hypothetical protein
MASGMGWLHCVGLVVDCQGTSEKVGWNPCDRTSLSPAFLTKTLQ